MKITPTRVLGSAGLAAALGVGLALGLNSSSGNGSAADVLRHDGYSVVKEIGPADLAKDIASDPSAKEFAGYIGGSAAMGFKGPNTEAVVQLTDSGKTAMSALAPLLAAGSPHMSVSVRDGYLVLSGPSTEFADGGAFNWGSK